MLTAHYLHYGGCQLIQVRGLSAGALFVEGIPGTAVLLHSTLHPPGRDPALAVTE